LAAVSVVRFFLPGMDSRKISAAAYNSSSLTGGFLLVALITGGLLIG